MLTGTGESLTKGAIGHAKDSVKSMLSFTYYVPIYNVPVRTGVILSRLWQHRVIRRPLQATYTLTTNQLLLHTPPIPLCNTDLYEGYLISLVFDTAVSYLDAISRMVSPHLNSGAVGSCF